MTCLSLCKLVLLFVGWSGVSHMEVGAPILLSSPTVAAASHKSPAWSLLMLPKTALTGLEHIDPLSVSRLALWAG